MSVIRFRTNERPRYFVAIGEEFESSGVRYCCVERVGVNCPADACIGCSFHKENRTCPPYVCSAFDRLQDGKSVWFVRIGEK